MLFCIWIAALCLTTSCVSINTAPPSIRLLRRSIRPKVYEFKKNLYTFRCCISHIRTPSHPISVHLHTPYQYTLELESPIKLLLYQCVAKNIDLSPYLHTFPPISAHLSPHICTPLNFKILIYKGLLCILIS